MKVFISHQQTDASLAQAVAARLKTPHGIETYLDVVDPNASRTGPMLGEYIRAQLGACTQLLAVVSQNTKTSWWVPWEIGISTEKDQPIATYAGDATELPTYLQKWPYLRSQADLDAYAAASKQSALTFRLRKAQINESVARKDSTAEFYRSLRAKLGQ